MIGQAGQWTRAPSTTPLQPKKWNAHFWITFNFWWLAGLVDGLEPHLPPLSSQNNEMLIFGFHVQLLMFSWAGQWTQTPSTTLLQSKKTKSLLLDYVQLLMIGRAGQWTWTPSTTPLQPKKWNAHFWIPFNFYVGQPGRWTQTPWTTPLQPKKWNAHFWIMFNFWWSARLVDGLKPHLPPLSSQKNEMPIFRLRWTSDNQPHCSMDLNPICYPSPATKLECSFLDYIHFWWSAGLVDGLKPHAPPLSSQNNEMFIFGLCSTSDDWLGWLMDLNPIHHPSPARKMKCLLLDYVQLLMIGWAGWWTWTPSTTSYPAQKNEMLIFGLRLTSDN